MCRRLLFIAALALLSGCTVVPYSSSAKACQLLDIASTEGSFAPAWYLEAGQVLDTCGIQDAQMTARLRACYAERRDDTSKVCEGDEK